MLLTSQDATTDGHIASEGALLVNIVACMYDINSTRHTGCLGVCSAQAAMFVVAANHLLLKPTAIKDSSSVKLLLLQCMLAYALFPAVRYLCL